MYVTSTRISGNYNSSISEIQYKYITETSFRRFVSDQAKNINLFAP